MAAAANTNTRDETDVSFRKRPRVADLPLSQSKRGSIDSLLLTFKKKGQFDDLRKNTFAQFNQSPLKTTLVDSIRSFTDAEIDRDPIKYLAKTLVSPLLFSKALPLAPISTQRPKPTSRTSSKTT
ncbi:unnamed protein product [Aureobasidium pullulans]|nr:unnamed protein product [Aureobasidium pullulans]